MSDITTNEERSQDELKSQADGEHTEDTGSKFQDYFADDVMHSKPKLTEVLLTFLRLRNIDGELAEIEQERGDLPESIEKLKSQSSSLKAEYSEKKKKLNALVEEKSQLESDDSDYEEKINKYDEQKYNVRSNKEYDEITKAVDSLFENVKKNEARLKEIASVLNVLDTDIEDLENKISSQETELADKEKKLSELNEQYVQEEAVLIDKRAEELSSLDEGNKFLYENVNKMYRGEAAAIVRKGNCSGCYNSIPPQRVIEIRAAEKVFTCQSCGRILISEDILGN